MGTGSQGAMKVAGVGTQPGPAQPHQGERPDHQHQRGRAARRLCGSRLAPPGVQDERHDRPHHRHGKQQLRRQLDQDRTHGGPSLTTGGGRVRLHPARSRPGVTALQSSGLGRLGVFGVDDVVLPPPDRRRRRRSRPRPPAWAALGAAGRLVQRPRPSCARPSAGARRRS